MVMSVMTTRSMKTILSMMANDVDDNDEFHDEDEVHNDRDVLDDNDVDDDDKVGDDQMSMATT